MKIVKEHISDLNAVLKMTVEKQDYEPIVDKKLKDYRKNVTMKGFRTGNAPLGLVKKMYGTSIMVEEVNGLISNNLNNYIKEEKLNILGEPIPYSDSTPNANDFNNPSDFQFSFEIGLAPEVSIELTKEVSYPFYTVNITQELIDESIERYAFQYGEQKNTEIVEADDIVYCEIIEINDEGHVVEDGLFVDKAPVSMRKVDSQEAKDLFLGANIDQVVSFDVSKAFANDADMAALFAVSQYELEEKVKTKKFNFTIKEILHYTKAELNQELFDKIYGEGVVNSMEELNEKVKEELVKKFRKDSDYRFQLDTKAKLMEMPISLPDDFLKRWMRLSDKNLTEKIIEDEYHLFAQNFRWELIRTAIFKSQNIKIQDADLKKAAIEVAKAQFAQYGLGYLPEEQYERFAETLLDEEKERKRLVQIAIETRVFSQIQSVVTLDEKVVSLEEFNKLFEN